MPDISVMLATSAINMLHATRAHRLFAPSKAGIGAILAFHRVLPREDHGGFAPNSALGVTPEFFAATIEFVQQRGYEIVSLAEAVQRTLAGGSARRFCCLTFDDGYRDNYLHAYPIARRYGVPMTIFVTTGFIDRSSVVWWLALERLIASRNSVEITLDGNSSCFPTCAPRDKESAYHQLAALIADRERRAVFDRWKLRYGVDFRAAAAVEMMSWNEVEELDASGLVEIGAHTVSHPVLRNLTAEAAREELRQSRCVLEEHLHRPVEFLAYPYGRSAHAGPREHALAAELGYAAAVTMQHGTVHAHHGQSLLQLPRITMNSRFASLRALDVFLSGATASLRSEATR